MVTVSCKLLENGEWNHNLIRKITAGNESGETDQIVGGSYVQSKDWFPYMVWYYTADQDYN